MTLRPIVRVTWVDSVHIRGEVEDTEIDKAFDGPGMMESVGFLVRDTKAGVIIAQEYQPADGQWRFLLSIPRVAIRKVRRVKS